jgi:two-component system, LytTR family, response regulator
MKIRTLLIDDEALARSLVLNFMKDNQDFEIIGEASNGFEAIKMINELKPELIFLDIQMPKLTGLEMLELIPDPPFVVFSTAYDQYALEAFEKNAIDYLLKPFSKDRFLKALQKVKEKIEAKVDHKSEIQNLIATAIPSDKSNDRIVIKDGSKIELIAYTDIYYLETYGDYVWIHTEKAKFLKQKTMKEFENLLPSNFLRVHRSFLVNVSHIQKLELYEKNSYQLLLKNGARVGVSKSGYKDLKDTLGW